MTADTLQELTKITIEDKEAMENLPTINLPLSQRLNQAQETILSLLEQLQKLQAHMNTKNMQLEKVEDGIKFSKSSATTIPGGEIGRYCTLADPQDLGNGKIL